MTVDVNEFWPEDAPYLNPEETAEERARREAYERAMEEEREARGQGRHPPRDKGDVKKGFAEVSGNTEAQVAGFVLPSAIGAAMAGSGFTVARRDLSLYNNNKDSRARVDKHLHRVIKEALDNEWTQINISSGLLGRRNDLVSMLLANRIAHLAQTDDRKSRRLLSGMGYDPAEARARLARMSVPHSPENAMREMATGRQALSQPAASTSALGRPAQRLQNLTALDPMGRPMGTGI